MRETRQARTPAEKNQVDEDVNCVTGAILNIRRSLKNSTNGLRLAWTEDHSFRNSCYQFFAGFVLATIITTIYDLDLYAWMLLVGSLFPIVIIETVNTAIEAVTDKASPERSFLAKKAKDIGSAAVLLTRVFAMMCWLGVFWHIWNE